MKKTQSARKMTISKESLRNLGTAELEQVLGGGKGATQKKGCTAGGTSCDRACL